MGGLPLEKRWHVSPWMPGTYDPELDLVYWGTGVAGPYAAISRGAEAGVGDLLYSNSTLALDIDTGKTTAVAAWHNAGDDCATGTATTVEIRRSGGPITEENYFSATIVYSGSAGSSGSLSCADLDADGAQRRHPEHRAEFGHRRCDGPLSVMMEKPLAPTYAGARAAYDAARAAGARRGRILLRELVPNVAGPMLSYAFVVVAVLIVAEGSLAYLGLGLQQPEPSWGNMIAEANLQDLRDHPHVALVPGTFMFLTVYSLNRVGERTRARGSGGATP